MKGSWGNDRMVGNGDLERVKDLGTLRGVAERMVAVGFLTAGVSATTPALRPGSRESTVRGSARRTVPGRRAARLEVHDADGRGRPVTAISFNGPSGSF